MRTLTSGVMQSFKNMVRDLLQGRVLSVEDVVDMLTMKDNENSVDDFETALLLLAEARVTRFSLFIVVLPLNILTGYPEETKTICA